MSDEEREAIEVLNYIKNKTPFIFWYEDKPYNRKETINTILNLIEKQSKEIEELTAKNKKHPIRFTDKQYNDVIRLAQKVEASKWEHKIKAKIEELEKEQEDNRKVLYNAVNNLCFKEIDKISNRISVNMSIRDILQSLLEGE